MPDVSSTIIVGEWALQPFSDHIRLNAEGRSPLLRMSNKDARDLAQALQVWIEQNALGAG